MSSRSTTLHSRALWLLSFGLWTVIALLASTSELMDVLTGDLQARAWEPVLWEFSSIYTWAVLTPFIVVFALRSPFSRRAWPRKLLMYLSAMVLFSLAHVAGMVAVREFAYGLVGRGYDFGNVGLEFVYEFSKDVVTFWTIVGLTYGWDFYRRFQSRQIEAAKLEAELARARLDLLQQRLQPHFLFNTLNTISSVMHEDVERADTIITKLGDLLRSAVRSDGREEVPLSDEIEALETYVEIMRVRFRDRLSVEMKIESAARHALVPVLLLQPLVENAIKHGIAMGRAGGRVFVEAATRNGRLRLRVHDDGPGVQGDPEAAIGNGFGIAGTIERLDHLYGDAHSCRVGPGPHGGFAITLEIPCRRAAGASGPARAEPSRPDEREES